MLQYALDLIETKQFYYLEQHLQLLTMYIPFSNFFGKFKFNYILLIYYLRIECVLNDF